MMICPSCFHAGIRTEMERAKPYEKVEVKEGDQFPSQSLLFQPHEASRVITYTCPKDSCVRVWLEIEATT